MLAPESKLFGVCFGSEADVPADGTARLLDYQELTSPMVEADVRLGQKRKSEPPVEIDADAPSA